jgi:hypothetical protein
MLFKQDTLREERLTYKASLAKSLVIPTFQAEERAAEKKGMLEEKDYLTHFPDALDSDEVVKWTLCGFNL